MDLRSPYLEAIQAIPGVTPGEKYKELNRIAGKIAAATKSPGDTLTTVPSEEVSEPLVPLVELEIANALRLYDGVVQAIKSEDSVIVDRAMKIKWFFRSTENNIISVEYFETHLLPYISLQTRFKLVKTLAKSLSTADRIDVAQQFYLYFSKKYGKIQAEPFLVACDLSFVLEVVRRKKLILSDRVIKILFVKRPNAVIEYLKLFKSNKYSESRDPFGKGIKRHSHFLPRLIKNHASAFIEVLEEYDSSLGVKLSNKATETFLKNNVDALLKKPRLYTNMMSLKVVAAKLTKTQYKSIFPYLFPEKREDFNYGVIQEYIEHYPEQERMSLILKTYREIYNVNFLDIPEAITSDFMRMLPVDERVRQARIKLEMQSKRFRPSGLDTAWRCYLPIEESIPWIKSEISKCSSRDDRGEFLCQMIYSCRVNDDNVALLDALRYFTTRHKNEESYIIFQVLRVLTEYFDLPALGPDCWAVLNDFIRFLHVKSMLVHDPTIAFKILSGSVHFNLNHHLPIENEIEMFIDINLKSWIQMWTTLEKYPECERRFLDVLLKTIPSHCPKVDESSGLGVLRSIIEAIYNFNTRISKANSKIEKLSIKNYPWFCESIKQIVLSKSDQLRWITTDIKSYMRKLKEDLYNEWMNEDNVVVGVETGEALILLKEEPKRIEDHWEDYLKEAIDNIYISQARRFILACRWHQNLPIKFVEKCIKNIANPENYRSMMILGILMEGSEFARVIELHLPKTASIDITSKEAQNAYKMVSIIPEAANLVNPPVPLSLMFKFCTGDLLQLGLISLTNICRRSSVNKVENFTKTLVDSRVSVKKHGIRLFSMIASIDDLEIFLTDLWTTEKHRSIRAVIFKKIYSLFVDDPCPENWKIYKGSIVELKLDDYDIIKSLMDFSAIPDEYIAEYINQILETLARLVADGFDANRVSQYIFDILSQINGSLSNLLPEEICVQFLKKYFCNPSLNERVREAGSIFVLNGYLYPAGSKLESRLSVFSSHYEDILKKYWDVPNSECATFYPINYSNHHFVNMVVTQGKCGSVKHRIMETILKSFLAVLKPENDFVSYALLSCGIALKDVDTPTEIAKNISQLVPDLVKTLSSELIVNLADIIETWIGQLIKVDKIDEAKYELIETLCRNGTPHDCILAAKLLFRSNNHKLHDRYCKIVKLLRQVPHPAVVSLVYMHTNTCSFT